MTAEKAREISMSASQLKKVVDDAHLRIVEAAYNGEFETRYSCNISNESFLIDSLKKDGYVTRIILHEDGRSIINISWEV